MAFWIWHYITKRQKDLIRTFLHNSLNTIITKSFSHIHITTLSKISITKASTFKNNLNSF